MDVRKKGHRLERSDVKDLKQMFPNAMTTRYGSTYLDTIGIDIMNIPFAWQCKSGYLTGINYNTLIKKIEDKQKEKTGIVLPVIVHHKKGRKAAENIIAMKLKDFFPLFKDVKNLSDTLSKIIVTIEYPEFIAILTEQFGKSTTSTKLQK